MASAVSICSNALLMLGSSAIASFDASEGEFAVAAGNMWPSARDAIIRANLWHCAIKRVILAPMSDAPAFEFKYQYQIPSDCLRVLSIGVDYAPRHKIEGNKILTDQDSCALTYLYRNDDVGAWDSGLVDVMTAYMASLLAYTVTRSASMAQLMQAEYLRRLRVARSSDSMQGTKEPMTYSSPLIAIRGTR